VCPYHGSEMNNASVTFPDQFINNACNIGYYPFYYTCKAEDTSGNINIDRKLLLNNTY